jgi:predicted peroxiredoxin
MNKYLLSTFFGVALLFFAYAIAEENKTDQIQNSNNESLEKQIEKAKELGVRILQEKDFLDLLK